MTELDRQRRFFAEEIEAVCRLKTKALVDAFAAVPRERFLPPGPWTVPDGSDLGPMALVIAAKGAGAPAAIRTQRTPDDDPRRVYHNIGVAIDPARNLFNGQPATLAIWLDALGLRPGARVLHIGCGLGYYTALMAHCVGAAGRVLAIDVDETLAAGARRNLSSFGNVEVVTGNGSALIDSEFDAILVNAGVTHPLDAWLDALSVGGRMILPLTTTMPAMGSTIGKGICLLVVRPSPDMFTAQVFAPVAIYSALDVRDPELNERVGKALLSGPAQWASVKRLRRDAHDLESSCWLHLPSCCFSAA